MVEEFVLGPSEESLALRTIVAAALHGHTSDQAILITYRYPLRPAVAPAAVRVNRRRRAGPSPCDHLLESQVGKCLARTPANRTCHGLGVESVDRFIKRF